MSQSATTNSSASPRPASGQNVQAPRPNSGAEVVVRSSPGGSLDMGFDPSTATASRPANSNDLVFELDGGGRVVVSDFFVVGDESLPSLRLPDGTVVASADFFAGSDLDMSTAAGPGAGAPGSGGTSYDDDAGSLLDGVDRYGMLGADYWDDGTEGTDTATGFTADTGEDGATADIPAEPSGPSEPSEPSPFVAIRVDESYLPGGTEQGEGSLVHTIAVPEGFTVDTEGWTSGGDEFFKEAPNGYLTYSENGGLTYTLDRNSLDHTLPDSFENNQVRVEAPLTLRDAAGNPFAMSVPVIILDDAPSDGTRISLEGVEGEKAERDGVDTSDMVSYAYGKLGATFFQFGADGPAAQNALWVTGLNGKTLTNLTVTADKSGSPVALGDLYVTQKFVKETEFVKNTLVVTLSSDDNTTVADLTLSANG